MNCYYIDTVPSHMGEKPIFCIIAKPNFVDQVLFRIQICVSVP